MIHRKIHVFHLHVVQTLNVNPKMIELCVIVCLECMVLHRIVDLSVHTMLIVHQIELV